MPTLNVDTLDFHFRPNIDASKYDEWRHYREVLRQNHKRAVDVVAVEMGQHPQHAWTIEAKDYRELHGRSKDAMPSEIAEDVFRKVNDTLEVLADAAANALENQERSHAARTLAAPIRQVVFHLEPYAGVRSKLFPDPSSQVLQKLKQLFPDHRPLVLNMVTTARADVPWTVS